MGVSVEGVIAFWVCVIVLVTAHRVIGKFALLLYVAAFLVSVIAAAQWLEINPMVLLFSILGGGVAVVLILALIGYMKGVR